METGAPVKKEANLVEPVKKGVVDSLEGMLDQFDQIYSAMQTQLVDQMTDPSKIKSDHQRK